MNANQRQNVINQIDKFKSLNLQEIFTSKFGADANPEETSAEDYSVVEIFSLSERMVIQLEERINMPSIWQMLPAVHSFNNDFPNCDVYSQLSQLVVYLGRGEYQNCVHPLKSLIYYQIINGFWDRPKKIELGVRMQNLEEIERKLSLIQTHQDERRKQLEGLLANATTAKESLEIFVSEETQKFEYLTANLEASNRKLAEIERDLAEGKSVLSDIVDLKNQSETLKKHIESIQDSAKNTQEEIDVAFETFKKASSESLTNSENKLAQIDTDHQYVSEKKEEVRKMMGYIADGTLSHSFNSRKSKIQISVWWWFAGSMFSAVLMGIWIFVVFIHLKADTGYPVADIFINIAKTSPMIVLFWFSLSQYQKERNLLEEYAFREAMAVTLTAYLEQLHGEEDKNKQDLLLRTVEKLYTKPKISSEGVGLFSFKSKDLVDLVKEVKDVMIELKSKK